MASIKVPKQKVILCGEFGVGKSSLFRRFATNTFVTATDRQSTLGLDHYDKEYTVADRQIRVIIVFHIYSIFLVFSLLKLIAISPQLNHLCHFLNISLT